MKIVTYKNQKTFNVAIMKYKNNSMYVQKQIDRVLKFCWKFARVYIDDVVIFFKTLNDYLKDLRSIFSLLSANNIFINFVKIFIDYSSAKSLNQHVNSFDLFINREKMKIISEFVFFFKILTILKHIWVSQTDSAITLKIMQSN